MKNIRVLFIIVLIALLIRLPNIGVPLSGDEIDTVGPARNFLLTARPYQYLLCDGTEYYNNTHPPLRILFYSLWASLFGFTAIAMRAVPIIFGLATIVLTYLLGKEIYSERAGLVAAALMALSRYHIFASEIVTNDNTLFIFLFEAAVYFFILYKSRSEIKFAFLAGAFIVASLYAKITFFVLIPSLIIYSHLHEKRTKKDMIIIATAFLVFLLSLFYISTFFDGEILSGPLSVLSATAGSHGSFDLYNKIFYIATITWQMTPFLSLIILLALLQMKRDSNYLFLASWILIPLVIFMAGSGDVQRYYTMALPAVFVLLGKFFEDVNAKDKHLWIPATGVLILAILLGINDLMGYYKPEFIAVFYILAAALVFIPKRNLVLLGAAIGLSVYFAFSPGFIVASGGQAASLVIDKSREAGIPYNNVFTTKDTNFYLTPQHETTRFCQALLDKNYLRQRAEYIALYHLPDERVIKDIAEICETPNFVEMNNRVIGVVCKVRK